MRAFSQILTSHLRALSTAYPLTMANDYSWLRVHEFKLPPGFSWFYSDVFLEIPVDYPLSPPGVGSSRIYLPAKLRYQGRRLKDLYENVTPGVQGWAWFCYQWVKWDPFEDDLIKFLEMVRADLTNPATR